MLALILLIAAFVLLLLAAANIPAGHVSLLAAGLACWVASILADHLAGHL